MYLAIPYRKTMTFFTAALCSEVNSPPHMSTLIAINTIVCVSAYVIRTTFWTFHHNIPCLRRIANVLARVSEGSLAELAAMRGGMVYCCGPDSTVWNFFIWPRARPRPSAVRGYLEMKGGLSLMGISMKTLLASVHAHTAHRGRPLEAYSAGIKASSVVWVRLIGAVVGLCL